MQFKKTEKRSKIKEITYFLLIYPVFPIIGGIIQVVFFGIAIVWMGSVISLLIIYFNLQNAKITRDPLPVLTIAADLKVLWNINFAIGTASQLYIF